MKVYGIVSVYQHLNMTSVLPIEESSPLGTNKQSASLRFKCIVLVSEVSFVFVDLGDGPDQFI